MAVLMVLDIPGATLEQYDRTNEILGIHGDEDAPAGLISHAAGPTDDGVLVVDVWESGEALHDFFEGRGVARAMQEAGAPEPGEPRVLHVHSQFEGGGTKAGVLMLAELDDFSTDTYDAMAATLNAHIPEDDTHPAVHHAAAVTESGGMLVVDIWESPEAFGAFAQAALAPAGEAAGVDPFEPRFVPVHKRIKG
jgi:heme-degrading monooxygenase HmoA